MPQWAGSCWYYLRYIDPKNKNKPWDIDKEKYDFRNINLLLNKSLFSSEKIVIKNKFF